MILVLTESTTGVVHVVVLFTICHSTILSLILLYKSPQQPTEYHLVSINQYFIGSSLRYLVWTHIFVHAYMKRDLFYFAMVLALCGIYTLFCTWST